MRIVTSAFAGAAFLPGSKVVFDDKKGIQLHGTVQRLFLQFAHVLTTDGTLWKVSFGNLTIIEPTPKPEMMLPEIETLGKQLIHEHENKKALHAGWNFSFDLAPTRAGICRYEEKQISLSVTYCLKASKKEIINTILHEIAHAIVGPKHGHDSVWKAVAQQIGCTAERCHRVQHTTPRWFGQCGCGKQWTRQRLTQRARTGLCPTCGDKIGWKREGIK